MNSAQNQIILKELIFEGVLSRGPGGQNVNKTHSAAQMHWDYMNSAALTADQKMAISIRLKNHINNEQFLYLRSDEFRDLELNKSRCIEKLLKMLEAAFFVPKKRKKTKPTRSAQRKRIESKKRRGEIKSGRKKVSY